MTASAELVFEDWRPKPDVVTRHVLFTGFDEDGNGDTILAWLRDEHRNPYTRGDGVIYFETGQRPEAIAEPGWWFIVGTRGEIYAVTAEVHADKYERAR